WPNIPRGINGQVESAGSSADAHRAYDEFLRQFPLCFGYWKK
ncbi:unnamed protein product, partial [Ectocarpus sp. 12 AP-2014]